MNKKNLPSRIWHCALKDLFDKISIMKDKYANEEKSSEVFETKRQQALFFYIPFLPKSVYCDFFKCY